jgi:two-component system, OmpR family, phosphate regulon sensor histidine kinase PhoR
MVQQAHGVVDTAVPVGLTHLLGRFTEIVDMVNRGESGLPALQLIIEVAQEATAAVGATFVEYGRNSGGRTIAACGELDWTLGRPVDLSLPDRARLTKLSGVVQVTADEVDDESAQQLCGRGIHGIVSTNVNCGGTYIGSVQVYFHQPRAALDPAHAAVLTYLAACAGHLYTGHGGLPVHGDGPIVASLADSLAVVGPDGIVRSWNPAAARLTARDPDDAVGKPLFFPVPRPGELVEHQMACGKWIEARSTSLAGTDATVVTFRERTDTSSRDEARDLFIALTSHELRTPVTVIRGYADTLVEHWDNLDEAARREAVFVVGSRARDLARLVDRLLSAASDLAGLVGATVLVPFDLVETLRSATGELAAELRRDLRLELPGSLPMALGDRSTLSTVVTELVTNACKYSAGRVDVELTAGTDAQTVWFRVADRGVGIRPEHVERAFERFWQLEIGDQRRYGGVGLGLYLVRRIVERQRGWVSLRPRDGGGSVAEVRLPRADARADGSPGEA